MRVALLGTGMMGAGMARNLLAAGHEVHAWNRTRERAEPLAADGAVVHDTPAEAFEGADALVTMLADGDAVAAATGGLHVGGVPWAQMSTVGVDETDAFAAHRARSSTRPCWAPSRPPSRDSSRSSPPARSSAARRSSRRSAARSTSATSREPERE